MKTVVAFCVIISISALLLKGEWSSSSLVLDECNISAIFNFGDSNSDTGSVSAAFHQPVPPYGETFFGKPSGRYSDGRLMIDFIAEKLGLPYLSAYLDSIGTNFQHGVNFASSGSTIQRMDARRCAAGFNPFTLMIQILQFDQFKARTLDLHDRDIKRKLPKPEDFSRAIYTFDSGQNDLHVGLVSTTEEEVKKSIPNIIDQFAVALKVFEIPLDVAVGAVLLIVGRRQW